MVIILTKFNSNTSTASRSSATIVVPYTVLTDEPVESGINEVVMKYAVETDCGSTESEKMIIAIEPTNVENILGNAVDAYKIVRDDRVLIIRDGKAYDLLGNKL